MGGGFGMAGTGGNKGGAGEEACLEERMGIRCMGDELEMALLKLVPWR
jgi:hypothetical protein